MVFVKLNEYGVLDADVKNIMSRWMSFLKDPMILSDEYLKDDNVSKTNYELLHISTYG